MSAKDKILAILITVGILGSFFALGWLTKTGGFGVIADTIRDPNLLTK